MITLSASGGSVTFTFSGNSTYLNDGTITVPVNSLALIIDESNMATFRKAASNDIFVSANIAEFGMTKDELTAWYKENMVGSTGVDSGTVQTMIDESISGKADSSAVTAEISAAVSGKADTSYVDSAVSGKVDTNTYNTYTAATDSRLAEDEEVTAAALVNLNEALSGKVDTNTYTAYTAATDSALNGKADTATTYTKTEVDNAITAATSTKQDTLVSGTNIKTINNESILGSGNIDIQGGGGITSGEVQSMIDESISGKTDESAFTAHTADTSIHHTSTSAVTSGSTDVLTSGGAYEQFGGLKLVKLTESEYAALVTKDPNVLYVVIPDPSNP